MNSKTHMNDDEIDLTEIFKKLWKEKVLIIGLSLLFGVLAYGIGTLIPKKFEASAKINAPSIIEFQKFKIVYDILGKTNEELVNLQNFKVDFYNNFKNEVFSVSNFANFLQQQEDTKAFLTLLQNKNSTVSQYLLDDHFKEKQMNLRIQGKTEVVPELIFVYPKELKGYDLVNRYIQNQARTEKNKLIKKIELNLDERLKNNNSEKTLYIETRKKELETNILQLQLDLKEYVNVQTRSLNNAIFQLELDLKEYVNIQTRSLNNRLFEYEQARQTAKSINLQDSIPTSILRGNSGSILNEPGALFYKGVKVLNSEIDNIKSDLKNLDKTEAYNKIVSAIEKNNNQLENLDKTAGYNKILRQEANLKNNISLLKQLDFNWNPILQQAIEPEKHISPKKSIFVLVGLFLGFFISLLTIFLRLNLLKKK